MHIMALVLAGSATFVLGACGSANSSPAAAGTDGGGAGGGAFPSAGGGNNASGVSGAGMIGGGGSSTGGVGGNGLSLGGGAGASVAGANGGLSGASGSGTGSAGNSGTSGAAGHSGSSAGGGSSVGGGPSAGGGGVSAGGGGVSAGGGGGSSGYHPCSTDGSPCKVLPLGDSITFGVNDLGNGGYRGPLFASVVAAGKKLTFTGSLKNGPTTVSGMTFPQNNEGHSGWGISEVNPNSGGSTGIATLIPTPAFSTSSGGPPNVILLHIGTNDTGTYSATQVTSDLSNLLDKLISNAPNAYIVVAQIIPLGYGDNSVIKSYNQSIPGLVQQRASAGKHITVVDMFTGFVPSTMLGSDSVHPNTSGYRFMASHWYGVIGPLLP